MKDVGAKNRLWYQRSFTLPATWEGQRILLHFGAVDWESTVFINGKEIGKHTGGYDPFSYDITEAIKPGSNTINVSVWDPTTDSYQPIGKQHAKPHGIWYTPTTGFGRRFGSSLCRRATSAPSRSRPMWTREKLRWGSILSVDPMSPTG